MVAFFRLVCWLVFTAVMAFVFLVLLDYGPGRFPDGIRKESVRVWGAVQRRVNGVAGAPGGAPGSQGGAARTQTR